MWLKAFSLEILDPFLPISMPSSTSLLNNLILPSWKIGNSAECYSFNNLGFRQSVDKGFSKTRGSFGISTFAFLGL
jgi:hypothetical protein